MVIESCAVVSNCIAMTEIDRRSVKMVGVETVVIKPEQ